MIEKIEKIKRQILDIERKIEKEEDIREIVALKKQKIKLESELVELMEQEFGEANDAGVISLAEAIQLYEAMPKKPVYATGIDVLDKHFRWTGDESIGHCRWGKGSGEDASYDADTQKCLSWLEDDAL